MDVDHHHKINIEFRLNMVYYYKFMLQMDTRKGLQLYFSMKSIESSQAINYNVFDAL